MQDQSETLLRLARKRINNLIGNLPLGIIIATADGTIEAVNRAVVKLFSYDGRELVGKNITMLLRTTPWAEADSLQQWHQENPERVVELEGWSKFEEVIPIDLSVREFDTDGRERFLVTIQDVSERFIADRLKKEFFQMISHDIRAPLSAVMTFLETVEKSDRYGRLNALGHERADIASHNVRRIITLAEQLLDLERLESKTLKLRKENVDLLDLIGEAANSVREISEANGVSITVKGDKVTAAVDRALIMQLLVGLLSNAINHSKGTSVEVGTEAVENQLTVSVRDHGSGVPDLEKQQLFERFKRGISTKSSGYGLGLAICKQIVELHSGRIGCTDGEGGGAVFWFTLPM